MLDLPPDQQPPQDLRVPRSPVWSGDPSDAGSGKSCFIRRRPNFRVTGNDMAGGRGLGENGSRDKCSLSATQSSPFQLNPLQRSSQDLSGTKIGRSLNLNEVCRIGIANSFKFETKSAGNE